MTARASLSVDLALGLVLALFGPGARTRVLPTKDWDGADVLDTIHNRRPFPNTSIGLAPRGLTDFTPLLVINPQYANAFHHSPVLNQHRVAIIYRQDIHFGHLSIDNLLRKPSGIWTFLAIAVIVKVGFRHGIKLVKLPFVHKAYRRSRVGYFIVLTVILSVLSNYLCLLFTLNKEAGLTIRNLGHLHELLASRKIKLVMSADWYMWHVINHLQWSDPELYHRIMAVNPPVIEPNETALFDMVATDLRTVSVGLVNEELQVKLAKAICDFQLMPLPSEASQFAFFFRAGLGVGVDEGQMAALRVLLARRAAHYAFPRAPCETKRQSSILGLPQLSGVVVSFGLAFAAAALLCLLERLIYTIPTFNAGNRVRNNAIGRILAADVFLNVNA